MKKNAYISSPFLAFLLIFLALGIGGFLLWTVSDDPARLGANGSTEDTKLLNYLVGFSLTIIGVVGGTVYREAFNLRRAGINVVTSYKSFFSKVFKSTDLIMGLAGSPLIFALLLDAMSGISITGLIVVALQNGFACSAIVGTIIHGPNQSELSTNSSSLR